MPVRRVVEGYWSGRVWAYSPLVARRRATSPQAVGSIEAYRRARSTLIDGPAFFATASIFGFTPSEISSDDDTKIDE